jgi:ubiquinone/menaquinone biosynthesis C-methylase UbiE
LAGLLAALKLRPGLRLLDAACGDGDALFAAFASLDGRGVFLAAEWEEEALRRFLARLEGLAEHPRYARIEVVRRKPERLPLPDACVDRVLFADRLHRAVDRLALLRELRRLLSPEGRLLLLDWRRSDELLGWPEDPDAPLPLCRVSEVQACEDLRRAGFRFVVSHAGFGPRWCLSAIV